jgi:putative RNA 2'-phosphotransferase
VPVSGKRLSYLLRHRPDAIDLVLDGRGRAPIIDLLRLLEHADEPTSREQLEALVQADDKGRFVIEGDHIRAAQGHSITVALELEVVTPPALLFHGTSAQFLAAIRAQGLRRGARHHVHLSVDVESARAAGRWSSPRPDTRRYASPNSAAPRPSSSWRRCGARKPRAL